MGLPSPETVISPDHAYSFTNFPDSVLLPAYTSTTYFLFRDFYLHDALVGSISTFLLGDMLDAVLVGSTTRKTTTP